MLKARGDEPARIQNRSSFRTIRRLSVHTIAEDQPTRGLTHSNRGSSARSGGDGTKGAASGSNARSEQELQRELDLPRGRGRVGKAPRRGAEAVARENDLGRVLEIWVVEKIEDLRPELQLPSFADFDVLEQRSVNVPEVRTTERSARHVPEGPLNRQLEGPRIEPVIYCPQNHRSLKVRIPVGCVGLIGIAGPGSIGASQRREGEPAQKVDDSIPLPAANQLVHNPMGAAS